jgi:hypothetical protein
VIEIYTVQMSSWRLAKERDIAFIDSTAKSGLAAFAPHFSDVMLYKAGQLSEQEYTEIYDRKMDESLIRTPKYWEWLKVKPKIAFACYCRAGVFCHRHLLAKRAENYLTKEGYEVVLMGEILKEQK